MDAPYLIIGLGNPGLQYAHTRHNAGFDVVELLCERHGLRLQRRGFKSLYCEERLFDKRVVLAQPQTYMNESGAAVLALAQWYKTPPERILVVYDDLDLPLGRLRIRASGSSGTHNGMRDITLIYGREDFPRIRLGIGSPPVDRDLRAWVTGRYTPQEQPIAREAQARAADAAELYLQEGVEAAMRRYNGAAAEKADKPDKPPESA